MNKKLKFIINTLLFISMLSIYSCNTVIYIPFSLAYKPEIELLLKSQDKLNINNINYELNVVFKKEQKQYGRGGLFGPKIISYSPSSFGVSISEFNNIYNTNKEFIITQFWIINNKYNYLFKTDKITKDEHSIQFNNYFIEIPWNYSFKENDIAIIKFQFKNKDYFLKQKIIEI